MEKIKEIKIDSQLELNDVDNYITRYGWGWNKTWIITKSKKQIMPKNSRLLMKLGCQKTTLPVSINETYPEIGDVIIDNEGNKLLIIDCDFF
jgi:hypothetical protein